MSLLLLPLLFSEPLFCFDAFDSFGIIIPRASAKLVPIELSISSTVDDVSVFVFFVFELCADCLLGGLLSSDWRLRLFEEFVVVVDDAVATSSDDSSRL